MKRRLRNKAFLLPKGALLLFVACILTACDKHTVYHAFRPLPPEGWKQEDTLFYDVAVPDSQTYYKLSVEIRHKSDYPYQNLNLTIGCEGPENSQLPTDTLRLTLSDEKGKWKGKGWGGLYLADFPAGSIRIGRPGNYRFRITHAFAVPSLSGISDVGIRLEPTD